MQRERGIVRRRGGGGGFVRVGLERMWGAADSVLLAPSPCA